VPETPEELDLAVRLAAFAFLEECLLKGSDETVSSEVLREGFTFRGLRVPATIRTTRVSKRLWYGRHR
jgi:hypothetical protein